MSFGCRPAVPKALRSTTLLDRNSFLNDTAGWGGLNTFPVLRASQTLLRGSTAVLSPIYPQGKAIPCCSFQNGATATLLRKRSSLVKSQQADNPRSPGGLKHAAVGLQIPISLVLVNGKARLGSRGGRRKQFTFGCSHGLAPFEGHSGDQCVWRLEKPKESVWNSQGWVSRALSYCISLITTCSESSGS